MVCAVTRADNANVMGSPPTLATIVASGSVIVYPNSTHGIYSRVRIEAVWNSNHKSYRSANQKIYKMIKCHRQFQGIAG